MNFEENNNLIHNKTSKRKKSSKLTIKNASLLLFLSFYNRITHSSLCNLMFGCRCLAPWNGGWIFCNVHEKSGPRCPWCLIFESGFYPVVFDTSADQDGLPIFISFIVLKLTSSCLSMPVWASILLSMFSHFCAYAMVGIIYKYFYSYPYFFWPRPQDDDTFQFTKLTRDSSGLPVLSSIIVGTFGGILWTVVYIALFLLCLRREDSTRIRHNSMRFSNAFENALKS